MQGGQVGVLWLFCVCLVGLLVLGLDLATLLSLVTLFASGSVPPRWLPDSPSSLLRFGARDRWFMPRIAACFCLKSCKGLE